MKILTLMLMLIAAVGQAAPNIIGNDDRTTVDDSAGTRFSPVVYIEDDGAFACSGALVAEDLIVTAVHCVLSGDPKKIKVYADYKRYKLNADSSYAFGTEIISRVKLESRQVKAQYTTNMDWAFVRIDRPLGRQFGYYKLAAAEECSGELLLAGFPFDKHGLLTVSSQCNVRDIITRGEDVGLIYHDCDIAFGNSGGPLLSCHGNSWADCDLIGITSSEATGLQKFISDRPFLIRVSRYVESYANISVNAGLLLDTYNSLLSK